MAEVAVAVGTSHSPMLVIPPHLWPAYAQRDLKSEGLVFPPDGTVRSYVEALTVVPEEIRAKPRDAATFAAQSAACVAALDTLAATLKENPVDAVVIFSDDQSEWFYDNNMPAISIYWGERVRMIPRPGEVLDGVDTAPYLGAGYGDVERDVPVQAELGGHLIRSLTQHSIDVSHFTSVPEEHGGTVTQRFVAPDGQPRTVVRVVPKHRQGLPHGYAFVVKRLYGDDAPPIVPIFINTCYPPNTPTSDRCFQLGQAVGEALASWRPGAKVAVVASGGLSHFVVDERTDRTLLDALATRDHDTLRALPRHLLQSGTSESLNWIALGGLLASTDLRMELVDYVPVYRSEIGTGGGWAFARWLPGQSGSAPNKGDR